MNKNVSFEHFFSYNSQIKFDIYIYISREFSRQNLGNRTIWEYRKNSLKNFETRRGTTIFCGDTQTEFLDILFLSVL